MKKSLLFVLMIMAMSMAFIACEADDDATTDGDTDTEGEGTENTEGTDTDKETVPADGDEEATENTETEVEAEVEGEQETVPTVTFCDTCESGESDVIADGKGLVLTKKALDGSAAAGDLATWKMADLTDNATITNFGFEKGALTFGYGRLARLAKYSKGTVWSDPKDVTTWTGPFATTSETGASLTLAVGDIIIMNIADADAQGANPEYYAFGMEVMEVSNDTLKVDWVLNPAAGATNILAAD